MIIVESKRKKESTLLSQYPGAVIVDVTSHAHSEMVKFSPFYPHGGIPVPFSGNVTSMSVEGVWQGLKVFATEGVDRTCFTNDTMKNLKRTTRRFGPPKGHRKGVAGAELLDYLTARKLIYLPTYKWVLDNRLGRLVNELRRISESGTLVLLDYETNADVLDPRKPLSHASLIKAYIEGTYPVFDGSPSVISTGVTGYTADSNNTIRSEEDAFKPGMRVLHPEFGEGTVKSCDFPSGRVIVDFDREGQKTLSLRLAKLTVIG